MLKLFGKKFVCVTDGSSFDNAVLSCLDESVKLIPFYAHRCFFDGMDNMPVVSFWQAVDSVIYGSDFANYLVCEFFGQECNPEHMQNKLKETGIWYEVLSNTWEDPQAKSEIMS